MILKVQVNKGWRFIGDIDEISINIDYKLSCMRKGELLIVEFDKDMSIYLLNDEGKTIERIN